MIIHDDGALKRFREKLLRRLERLGVERLKANWGYTWKTPEGLIPFNLEIDLEDPPSYQYRLRLAREHLEETERLLDSVWEALMRAQEMLSRRIED